MPINSCNGSIANIPDPRLNKPQNKLNSSMHTQHKKILNVIRANDGEDQTQKTNFNCPNNKQITNVGGPGDRVKSVPIVCCVGSKQKNRLVNKRSGVDVKHNSYERYLARKKGYVFQQQSC